MPSKSSPPPGTSPATSPPSSCPDATTRPTAQRPRQHFCPMCAGFMTGEQRREGWEKQRLSEQAIQGRASPPCRLCAGRPRQNLRTSGKIFCDAGGGFRKRPLTRLGPEDGRRDGAKPLVGGQLSELCDVFPPDFPLHEGSGRSLNAKPQVSLKQVGSFCEMAAHNSLK